MAIIDLDKKIGKNHTEDGAKLDLVAPDGDSIGVSLIVRSVNATEPKRIIRKQSEQSAKKSRRGKKETTEEITKANAEMVKALVIGGDTFKIGKVEVVPGEMTLETTTLLINSYPFIMTQIIEFASDDTNFYGDIEGN